MSDLLHTQIHIRNIFASVFRMRLWHIPEKHYH